MKGTILGFRRGRHILKNNQFLLELPGVDTRNMASKFIGKRVSWQSSVSKKIYGKITCTHGNSGVMRVRFNKGLPGTVIGKNVEIIEKVKTSTQKVQKVKKVATTKTK